MISTFTWYFLSLSGRVSRQEFWLGCIGSLAILSLLIRIFSILTLINLTGGPYYQYERDHVLVWPIIIALLIVIWSLTAILVKRLHDLNVSGWWLCAILTIPLVGRIVGIDTSGLFFLTVAVLGLLPGTLGTNRFGLDPPPRNKI